MEKPTRTKPTPIPPLTIRKLDTSEDEGLQAGLERLARADRVAPDYVLSGAIMEPTLADDWARLDQDVSQLAGEHPENMDAEDTVSVLCVHREWAYWIGLAVGLRLAPFRGDQHNGGAATRSLEITMPAKRTIEDATRNAPDWWTITEGDDAAWTRLLKTTEAETRRRSPKALPPARVMAEEEKRFVAALSKKMRQQYWDLKGHDYVLMNIHADAGFRLGLGIGLGLAVGRGGAR